MLVLGSDVLKSVVQIEKQNLARSCWIKAQFENRDDFAAATSAILGEARKKFGGAIVVYPHKPLVPRQASR